MGRKKIPKYHVLHLSLDKAMWLELQWISQARGQKEMTAVLRGLIREEVQRQLKGEKRV